MNKLILLMTFMLLQSCMLGLGVAYSPEYGDQFDDSWVNPVGVIRLSQKVAENKAETARVTVYGEHISSISSQKDNQNGGVGGINMIGVMVEFGK